MESYPSRDAAATRAFDIEALFGPAEVVAFDLVGDGDERWLHVEERSQLGRAVVKRRREFAAGRQCARSALALLGQEPGSIPVGDQRQPVWPPGVVGSITHTSDYCVAVVGRCRSNGSISIGVDTELLGRVRPDLFTYVLGPREQRQLQELDPDNARGLATLIFCAKEAFYKAQFPLTRAWVDFDDISVSIEEDHLRIERAADRPALAGLDWPIPAHWLRRGNVAVVGVTVQQNL